MTRGEAVTALRGYIRCIPKENLGHVYLKDCWVYEYITNKIFVAEELIREIQDHDRDPLETVRMFVDLMSDTQLEADPGHVLTLRFALMSERNGLEVYQFLREKERGYIYVSGHTGRGVPFYAKAGAGHSDRNLHRDIYHRNDQGGAGQARSGQTARSKT